MESWEKELIKPKVDIISKIPLRLDFRRVFISALASQLYCEQKVEFDYKYGIEDTEQQITGTEIHDAAVPTVKVTPKELVKTIKTRKRTIAIFPVYFKYKEIVISGIHDGVVFKNGKPILLIEIKTNENLANLDQIFFANVAQTALYARSIKEMGFDISNMEILIIKIMQDIDKDHLKNDISKILEDSNPSQVLQLENDKIKGQHFPQVEDLGWIWSNLDKQLDDLLNFWSLKREPRGADPMTKCNPCPHKSVCFHYQVNK
ncbi:MAG: hypothetical protein ACW99Q_09525 [Candidatus Kariarchaeaceae archaeon]|jgi:hypothetical protein